MSINKRLHANNAKTTLSLAAGPADTTITVVSAAGFPTLTTGYYFLVTLDNGAGVEVIQVTSVTGNTFTCSRAQEGTAAASFPAGTRVENRVTKGTLDSFLTSAERFVELASLDLLTSPDTSMSNTYICHSVDDGGNPVIAIKNGTSSWRFTTHPRMLFSGSVSTSTTTSIVATVPASSVASLTAGKYIIQFLTGVNYGQARVVTVVSGSTISWATALGVAPSGGDQFEIYKSTTSIILDLEANASSGIIYSILLGD